LDTGYEDECSEDDDVRPLSSVGTSLCMLCLDDHDDDRQDDVIFARQCCPIDLGLNSCDFEGYTAASESEESEEEEG